MSRFRALVVDDEIDILELAELALKPLGIEVVKAETLAEARARLKEGPLDFCLTDLRLPDGSGLDLVAQIQKEVPDLPVAVITAYGDMETAIQALKQGAFDFVSKPVDLQVLRNLARAALKQRARNLKPREEEGGDLDRLIVGRSPAMQRVKRQILKVARSQAPVLILGETGTGKELVAKTIHRFSPRGQGPFVPVNCGAIPKELLESELFGYKKGAFSGAVADKKGLFVAANKGTLFLDEVADLPLDLQVKLLRVLQEKRLRPLGGLEEVPIDVRIVSATNRDPRKLVAEGKFREDLYYRLNVIEIRLPPLRERQEDIPLLANHILQKLARHYGEPGFRLTPRALKQLGSYPFPGNVRELENILERAVVMSEGNTIDAEALQLPSLPSDAVGQATPSDIPASLDDYLAAIERQKIMEALERTRWNRTQAAKLLGMTPRMLRYRMEKLGIS